MDLMCVITPPSGLKKSGYSMKFCLNVVLELHVISVGLYEAKGQTRPKRDFSSREIFFTAELLTEGKVSE
jgi:hypothetical protein